MKRNVPINPGAAKRLSKPALIIGETNPNLSAGRKDAIDVHEHLARVEGVFEHVGKDRDIVRLSRDKFVDQAGVNHEACTSCDSSGVFVYLESLELTKSVPCKDAKAATFIAADVE